MTLDLPAMQKQLDSGNMYEAIQGFPQQILEAFKIVDIWQPECTYQSIHSILILGMGGSAIGGDVVRVMVQDSAQVPIMVNRSYNLPAWVDGSTLVIANSYSGNTEETLSAYQQAREAKAQMLVISTGGTISEWAHRDKLDLVAMPAGLQPRAALGYSFTLLMLVLNKLGFVVNDAVNTLHKAVFRLKEFGQAYQIGSENNPGLSLAQKIHDTIPVIYGSEDLTWVAALRFRGQLAENAKMLAWHHHLPEQNHNEIEGWSCNEDLLKRLSIIWFYNEDDHPRIQARMKVTRQLLEDKAGGQYVIKAQAESRIERLLKLIHCSDWISYYAALLNGQDPTPVDRIGLLKLKMSEL